MLWLLSGPQEFTCWISFALLKYSVLCTLESLALLYLILILVVLSCKNTKNVHRRGIRLNFCILIVKNVLDRKPLYSNVA